MDNTYYVTWGASHLPSRVPSMDAGKTDSAPVPTGSSMPPHGKMLGKLEPSDFKQVINKGLRTYGKAIHVNSYQDDTRAIINVKL